MIANLAAAVAEDTFRVYHRLGPYSAIFKREGVETKRAEAIAVDSGAESDSKARTARTILTRTFVVRRVDRSFYPKRGDIVSVFDGEEETIYSVASDAEEPAVQLWRGNRNFLKVRCRLYTLNKTEV